MGLLISFRVLCTVSIAIAVFACTVAGSVRPWKPYSKTVLTGYPTVLPAVSSPEPILGGSESGFGSPEEAEVEVLAGTKQEEFDDGVGKLREVVTKSAKNVADGTIRNGTVSTPLLGIKTTSPKAKCVAPVGLKIETLQKATSMLLGGASISFDTPLCASDIVVNYPYMGNACNRTTNEFQEMLFNKGIILMLAGASPLEAFAPLEHFRVLAANLVACFPSMNPSGFTSAPDSYLRLYEVYDTRLLGRTRSLLGDFPPLPTPSTIAGVQVEVQYKLERLLSSSLDDAFDYEWFVPSQSEVTLALSKKESGKKRLRQGRGKEAYKKLWRISRTMTEEQCDEGANSPNSYFLHTLDSVGDNFQHCCASPCSALVCTTTSQQETLSTCCLGCNRFSCPANSEGEVVAFANIAEIASIAKIDVDPVVYTFTV